MTTLGRPLAPTHRRVLWLILEAAQDGRQLSYREIAKAMGWTGFAYVQEILEGFVKRGLITRSEIDKTTGRPKMRTIRPAFRLELIEDDGHLLIRGASTSDSPADSV